MPSRLRIKPRASDLVAQYMAFTSGEQNKPTILRSHLAKIVEPMRIQLQNTSSDDIRATLARDIAFFTVAFSSTKRGAELTATLLQRVLRLPKEVDSSCLISNGEKPSAMRWITC